MGFNSGFKGLKYAKTQSLVKTGQKYQVHLSFRCQIIQAKYLSWCVRQERQWAYRAAQLDYTNIAYIVLFLVCKET